MEELLFIIVIFFYCYWKHLETSILKLIFLFLFYVFFGSWLASATLGHPKPSLTRRPLLTMNISGSNHTSNDFQVGLLLYCLSLSSRKMDRGGSQFW